MRSDSRASGARTANDALHRPLIPSVPAARDVHELCEAIESLGLVLALTGVDVKKWWGHGIER